MRIAGDADARFVAALRAELARRRACDRAYRLELRAPPPARAGRELRFMARVTVLTGRGNLAGEYGVPASVAVGAGDTDAERRLLDAAGRRAAELFGANFR
jgi:hypothetical protein